MDPVSQACFGASLSQSFTSNKTTQLSALLIGALAGMAADLDVLIYSKDDPLLFLEFHRQFTHSLIFIPVGALLCALAFYPVAKNKLPFNKIYLFSFLGYATHGLLDACTSYGTQLFWPFSSERVAWNTISIIDPLFTLPVTIFILLAVFKKNRFYARIAFIYSISYLSLGLIQHHRAEQAAYVLAQQRGHQLERIQVKPSFGNRHVWKLIYEYNGRYYIDAVKLLWEVKYFPGSSVQKLDIKRDFPGLPENSQQAKDIERFRWFSDNFLAVDKENKNMIMDVRYSLLPNSIKPLWSIKINIAQPENHIQYIIKRNLDAETRKKFMDMLF